MSVSDTRYKPNDAECAAKVIDGEAVIINLLNGTYYSLDKAGGTIWELVAEGHSVDEVVTGVAARYAVDEQRARADVERLVNELVSERIIVVASGAVPPHAAAQPSSKVAYDEPSLTTYRDMADLLALDPPMPRLEDIVWGDSGDSGGPQNQ